MVFPRRSMIWGTWSKTEERLPVFDTAQAVRGNRLLLYPITIEAQ